MTSGLWIAVAAIAVALVFGGFRALTDGRFRGTHRVRGGRVASADDSVGRVASADDSVGRVASGDDSVGRVASADDSVGRVASASERIETPAQTTWDQLGSAVGSARQGERATLVQFSSAFCAPCRATRRVLEDVAEREPGVVHVEIDAEHHLEVVRRLGILRTPTTIVLDGAGHEVARAAGAPRREQVLGALPR